MQAQPGVSYALCSHETGELVDIHPRGDLGSESPSLSGSSLAGLGTAGVLADRVGEREQRQLGWPVPTAVLSPARLCISAPPAATVSPHRGGIGLRLSVRALTTRPARSAVYQLTVATAIVAGMTIVAPSVVRCPSAPAIHRLIGRFQRYTA